MKLTRSGEENARELRFRLRQTSHQNVRRRRGIFGAFSGESPRVENLCLKSGHPNEEKEKPSVRSFAPR